MRSRNVRALAAQILVKLLERQGSLSTCLADHKEIKEYALLQELCFGTCRWFFYLDYVLNYLLEKPLKSKDKDIHCFSHDQDEVALTTKGYFWSGWGNQLTKKSICVMPPQNEELPSYIAGVCSDYIRQFR